MGKRGEYHGDLPTVRDISDDMVENFNEETRKMIPMLGDEPFIPRRIIKSITLLPTDNLPDLFIEEIKKSNIDIGDSIVIRDENTLWKFEGNTYSYRIHDNTFYLKSSNIIKISDDEYWIKVNPCDEVINTNTDKRGYPGSCGTGNKNKDVIIIIKGNKETDEVCMDKDMISISELEKIIENAKKQGIREIEITKQVFIPSDKKLDNEDMCLNMRTSE